MDEEMQTVQIEHIRPIGGSEQSNFGDPFIHPPPPSKQPDPSTPPSPQLIPPLLHNTTQHSTTPSIWTTSFDAHTSRDPVVVPPIVQPSPLVIPASIAIVPNMAMTHTGTRALTSYNKA